MSCMLSAKPAILLDLEPLGIVLFVLERIVVALLAFLTAQRDFVPATFTLRHCLIFLSLIFRNRFDYKIKNTAPSAVFQYDTIKE